MHNLQYNLVRAKRTTISVVVSGGKITVKAPYGVPAETIENFLTQKKSWIEKKISEQMRASDLFASVKNGSALLDAGTEKTVVYNSAKNEERNGVLFLKNERAIRAYFEKTRGWLLGECLYEYARRFSRQPSSLSLCDFKARWGSCDAAGNIKLNWRLMMLPPNLRDYVLIHELAHLKEMNHSAAFWKEVQKLCPDYRERRKALKDYSFLTLLYRQK